MDCTGCHNPHGGPNHNLIAETPNETCYKCHSEKAGPFAFEHAPVADDCLNCHKPHGSQNDRLLKQPQPYLCLACHKWPHGVRPAAASGNIPQIGQGGNQNFPAVSESTLMLRSRCTDCHDEIHGSDWRTRFKNN
jgi:DmsE family decaheme c-type cytochrome